jgi:hypothetical protein
MNDIPSPVCGVFGHPGPLWKKDLRLSDLGINALFVDSPSLDGETIERARDEGCLVFAEFAACTTTTSLSTPRRIRSEPTASPQPPRPGSWVPAPPIRASAPAA